MKMDRIFQKELDKLLNDGVPWIEAERQAAELAEQKYYEMADEARSEAGCNKWW